MGRNTKKLHRDFTPSPKANTKLIMSYNLVQGQKWTFRNPKYCSLLPKGTSWCVQGIQWWALCPCKNMVLVLQHLQAWALPPQLTRSLGWGGDTPTAQSLAKRLPTRFSCKKNWRTKQTLKALEKLPPEYEGRDGHVMCWCPHVGRRKW